MKIEKITGVAAVLFLTLFFSCEDDKNVPITSVRLGTTELHLSEGETHKMEYAILPENATNKTVIWESSAPDIVSVDTEGVISALKDGVSVISIITEDGDKKDRCNVVVSPITHPVESVSLDITEYSLDLGKSIKLQATVMPENATNKNLTWESSDSEIAKVTAEGVVLSLKEGNTTITVHTEDGDKTATCNITVVRPTVPVEKIILDKDMCELYVDGTFKLNVTVLPENATDKKVSWSSSSDAIATVDNDGNIIGVSIGEAEITVTSADGNKTAVCKVSVIGEPLPMYIDEYGINQGYGIEIGNVIWAPVNCGYKAPDGNDKGYPYGKLYQYGRKDGQGYKDLKYEDQDPVITSTKNPASIDEADARTFYTNWSEEIAPKGTWGGADGTTKTKYDPCPDGWRVPTTEELKSLKMESADLAKGSTFQNTNTLHESAGRWFGENHQSATLENPNGCIFMQLAGYRDKTTKCSDRGISAFYLTSDCKCILMKKTLVMPETPANYWGMSVRCVKE